MTKLKKKLPSFYRFVIQTVISNDAVCRANGFMQEVTWVSILPTKTQNSERSLLFMANLKCTMPILYSEHIPMSSFLYVLYGVPLFALLLWFN